MPIPLPKLPILVITDILKNMTIYEIIPFSFTSKRGARLSEISLKKFPKLGMKIDIGSFKPFFTLRIGEDTNHFLTWFIMPIKAQQARKMKSWNALGMTMYPIQRDNITQPYDVLHTKLGDSHYEQANTVIMHFLKTFKSCQVVELIIDYKFDNPPSEVLKTLSGIKEVAKVALRDPTNIRSADNTASGRITEYILQNIKITKTLFNETRMLLSSTHRFPDQLYCEDSILCHDATWMLPETLLRLDCAQLLISKSRLRIRDLMAFLRRWQQSTVDEIKRIKEWKIEFPLDSGSIDFKELKGTPCDVVKRPQFNGTGAIDIKRHADGLEATIWMWTNTTFQFTVHH